MVRDEAEMLPRWLAYYAGQVGIANLTVLDDGSVDGSTRNLPCGVRHLDSPSWPGSRDVGRTRYANDLARKLLRSYDVVIYTDADEFLVPDPARCSGLVEYLARHRDAEVIAPVGLNVLHDPEREPALHDGAPVLRQRRLVKYAPVMCKPLVKRVATPWKPGFHGIDQPFEVDPDLWLLHLRYVDLDLSRRTAERRHQVYLDGGRGGERSAWALEPDELAALQRSWVLGAAAGEVPDFDPGEIDLTKVVRPRGGGFRSGGTQLRAMKRSRLRQVPERFRDVF